MARIPEPAGVDHPAFALVLKRLDKGRAWVKLSGAYQDTRTGPQAMRNTLVGDAVDDVVSYARAL